MPARLIWTSETDEAKLDDHLCTLSSSSAPSCASVKKRSSSSNALGTAYVTFDEAVGDAQGRTPRVEVVVRRQAAASRERSSREEKSRGQSEAVSRSRASRSFQQHFLLRLCSLYGAEADSLHVVQTPSRDSEAKHRAFLMLCVCR